MAIPLLNSPAALPVPHDDGSWHSAEISRVIECIREYDSRLDVLYIPEHMRSPGDAAFAIVENLKDGRQVVAFYVNTEEEMNLGVLDRIIKGDSTKQDVQSRLEAANEAARRLRRKRYEDEMAEAHELAHFMFKSNKSSIKHNGKKIDL